MGAKGQGAETETEGGRRVKEEAACEEERAREEERTRETQSRRKAEGRGEGEVPDGEERPGQEEEAGGRPAEEAPVTAAPRLGVSITWLGHGTVLYRSEKGRSVLVDAWVDSNPACPAAAKELRSLDLLLITHGHSDHFDDCFTLARKHKPDIVCMFEIAQYLQHKGIGKLHGMNKGGTVALHGIKITMVHAVHSSSIREGDSFYPGGEPCGFVIELENGTRVYHAGDTAVHSDMKLIGEIYQPRIAALPIGDLYTMSPVEAAVAARMLGARTVVPIHHSTFPALTGTPAALREKLKDRPDIEVVEMKPGETIS